MYINVTQFQCIWTYLIYNSNIFALVPLKYYGNLNYNSKTNRFRANTVDKDLNQYLGQSLMWCSRFLLYYIFFFIIHDNLHMVISRTRDGFITQDEHKCGFLVATGVG